MDTTSSVNIRFASKVKLSSIEEIRLDILGVSNRYTVHLSIDEQIEGLTYFKWRSENVPPLDPERVAYSKKLSMREEQARGLILSVLKKPAGEQELKRNQIRLEIAPASKIGHNNTIEFSESNGVFSAKLINEDEVRRSIERMHKLIDEYFRQQELIKDTAENEARALINEQ